MSKTRFFRIAVQGATATDGRTIEREMLTDTVTNFNRDTYGPRINMEHIRGFSAEGPFNAYGDVLAVKTEEVEITLAGKKEKRLALFAQLDPTDELVRVNQARQKIYTSCEFAPNFGGSGKFGLVGVAVTDNPASLGTEMLQFSGAKPMLDARKTAPENFFSASEEGKFELEVAADPQAGWADKLQSIFDGFAAKLTGTVKEVEKPVEPPVPANDNDPAKFAKLIGDTVTAAIGAYAKSNDAAVTALNGQLSSLTTKLEQTEKPGFSRGPATGGATAIQTDC